MNVEHFLLGGLQSGSAFSFGGNVKFNTFKGGDGDLLLSCIQLFAFIIRGVILENGVSSQNDSLDKCSESWINWIITDFNFVIS